MGLHNYSHDCFAVALALFLFLSVASSLSFNLTSFNDTSVNYYGNASFSSRGIDLTLYKTNQELKFSTGRAVYHEPLQLWDKTSGQAANFTTHFTFFMDKIILEDPAAAAADGIAFFLAPYPADQIPEKSYGLGLGIFNTSAAQIIAVEFDTYNNTFDPTTLNHIGIDVNSVLSVAYVGLDNASMITKYSGHATVSYDASNMTLSASLNYPEDPKLVGISWNVSYAIDLRNYLPEKVAIGFSAGTGIYWEFNTIKSWEFKSTNLQIITQTPVEKRNVNRLTLQVVVNVVIILGLCFILFLGYFYWKRRSKRIDYAKGQELLNIDGILNQNSRAPKRFDYKELATATRDFANEEKLGEGGFGAVYRGVLGKMNDLPVAIKKITKGSKQGMKEYMAEITIISQLRHRHLVQLIGYCHEQGELLLVYEYMPNKSLDAHLYDKNELLGSKVRYKIALDLASALMYLHDGWEHGVVHRDIKPSNVMLDSNFNAKLGDFGLAKLVEHDRSLLATVVAGTRGYMAPEYMYSGKAGKECDVYSFGILAMELACGRKPIYHSEEAGQVMIVELVELVWELYKRNRCHEAVDKRLEMEENNGKMEHLMVVGLWCAHPDYKLRPTIGHAFCVLNFDAALPNLAQPIKRRRDYAPATGETSRLISESEVLTSSSY